MDQANVHLLDALRAAVAAGDEQRLYRAGKQPGLFPARTSAYVEAANRALTDGLLELTRTETRGKTQVEWVKATPKGVAHLLEQESPLRVLEELTAALKVNQDGLPGWLADLKRSLEELTHRFLGEVHALGRRLDQLTERAGEAMRRVDKAGPPLPAGAAAAIPWAHEAAAYLERRRDGGLGGHCPLPELFAALKDKESDLTIKDFHLGLRRLYDRGALRLLPYTTADGPPEPEYALLDGPTVYYFAAR